MAGITAALEAAEVGQPVILVERNPYLGGRVAQMYRYFPKLCPPSCGLEINYKRIKSNPRLTVKTMTEVAAVSGEEGAFEVELKTSPRFVNDKCTNCGGCTEACEMEVDNPFNYGMDRMKAAYLPHKNAFPMQRALHPELAASDEAAKVKDACKYGAINLDDAERSETVQVASIVWATGWDPFQPQEIEYYKFGQARNVVTNVMFERICAEDGPTAGKIQRPSDGEAPRHIVFVQCAGSRDENHLAYCSGFCCLASLKQATYVREQLPETKVTVCFIDIRTPDRLEDFYAKVQADDGVTFIKSKIADITEDAHGGELRVHGEDTLAGKRLDTTADMVVLATGLVPNGVPAELAADDYGFLLGDQPAGHFPAGCVMQPVEVSSTVQDGTAAALRAIQAAR